MNPTRPTSPGDPRPGASNDRIDAAQDTEASPNFWRTVDAPDGRGKVTYYDLEAVTNYYQIKALRRAVVELNEEPGKVSEPLTKNDFTD